MFTVDELLQEPGLKKLGKADRELVLAFTESLAKTHGSDLVGPDPRFQQMVELAKANPQPGDVHLASELTDLSVVYLQDQGNFTASSAGIVSVERQSDGYLEYNRADMFRIASDDLLRGPGAESAGSGFDASLPTYSCKVYAWHKDVDEQLMANQRVGDPVDDALAYVVQALLIAREQVYATTLLTTGVWGADKTGVPGAPGANQFKQWDAAGSTPRDDLSLYALNIHEVTGIWPNCLVLQPYVLKALLLNAQVTSAFQYTVAGAMPDLQALAKALFSPAVASSSAPQIKIAGGINTTTPKGAATDTITYVAGKVALLAYVNERPGLRSPSAWYTFAWAGLLGANAFGARIKDFPLDRNAVPHRIEGEMAFDIKKVSAPLGIFMTAAVS
jgi:hypothetical protein